MKGHLRSMFKAINKFCPNPKDGAEIGVYKGETTRALHLEYPNCHMLMVDPWKAWEAGDSYHGDRQMGRWSQEKWDSIYAEAVSNSVYGPSLIYRSLSVEAAKSIDNLSLDFVFLDGNHHYQETMDDIIAWEPKCKTLLMFHDYYALMERRGFWGVRKAVDERYAGKTKIHRYLGNMACIDLRTIRNGNESKADLSLLCS